MQRFSFSLKSPESESRNRSASCKVPGKKELDDEQLLELSQAIMDLNMSTKMMRLSLKHDTEADVTTKRGGATIVTEQMKSTGTLAKFTEVSIEANECLKSAQAKIDSLILASDETLLTMKKQVEEAHEQIDSIHREHDDNINALQQKLDEANSQKASSGQELKDSSHWIISKEEVELTSKKLGDGGYGTVTVANFRGIQVAAKKIHGMILSSHNRRMFDREMNIASKVRHPNCVQFLGAVVEKEPIILMELMPTVLREILPKELNRLSQDQIPPICRDIARALTYLHSMKPQPVIHRDVSSANVLLEPIANSLWKAKISDYGSANFSSMLNTTGPGNAVYAAPEVFTTNLQSSKMDVFSFGVLVVEIYLRELPDPECRDEMVHQVELMYPQIAPLIKKCLCEKPEDRLDMLEILKQFI